MRFYYELALKLHMTVAELLEKTSSKELTGWRELFKLQNEEHEIEAQKRH